MLNNHSKLVWKPGHSVSTSSPDLFSLSVAFLGALAGFYNYTGGFSWTSGRKRKSGSFNLASAAHESSHGLLEGLTTRSLNPAPGVSKCPSSFQRSVNAAALNGAGIKEQPCITWAPGKALDIRKSWTLTLALATLISSQSNLSGVIVCAGLQQLGSSEFLKQTARSCTMCSFTCPNCIKRLLKC